MIQLDLLAGLALPYRPQTLADLDRVGEQAAEKARELHEACPADSRAVRAAHSALIIFGTIEVLKRRGHQWNRSPLCLEKSES